jgi:hypothetical protein
MDVKRFTRTERERYSELRFPALDQSAAIANLLESPDMQPRRGVRRPDALISTATTYVNNVVDAIARYNDAVDEAAQDAHLSPEGRAARVAPQRDAAIAAFEAATTGLEKAEADVDALSNEVFAPPALAEGDVVGALRDIEIRQRYYAMPSDQQAALLARPSAPTVLAALLRDPIDTPQRAMARDLWIASLKTTRPGDVGEQALREGAAQWFKSSLVALGAILDASADYRMVRENRKRAAAAAAAAATRQPAPPLSVATAP